MLTGFNILLSIGRYYIRHLVYKRLHWDDLAHLIALLCNIALSITITHIFLAPVSAESIKEEVVISFLGITALWAVKFSFLLFYKLLFWVSEGFQKAFWVVAGFLFVSYWVPIAAVLTECGPIKKYDFSECIHLPYLEVERSNAECRSMSPLPRHYP